MKEEREKKEEEEPELRRREGHRLRSLDLRFGEGGRRE